MSLLLLFAAICLLCNDSGQVVHKHTSASVTKLYNTAEWRYRFEAGKIVAGVVKSNGSVKSADTALSTASLEEYNNFVISLSTPPIDSI